MATVQPFQNYNLLTGARNAYAYLQSLYTDFAFKVAQKNSGQCGSGWFPDPFELSVFTAIFVANGNSYRITSTNNDWTKFTQPELIGPGPWVGVAEYNPFEIEYTEMEGYKGLQNFLLQNDYTQVQYTQVGLVSQAYPPYHMVYGYDLDLSPYGFNITQYISVPKNGGVGQANEMEYCPLPPAVKK